MEYATLLKLFQKMFLIDKPYVSEFLMKTLIDYNYTVIATREAKELLTNESINWLSENDAINQLSQHKSPSLYTNSENSIAWITKHFAQSALSKNIQHFKDKLKFRNLLQESYSDFFYTSISLDEIQALNPLDISFPFVIKPSLGFFSIGVHIIHNINDWKIAVNELREEKLLSIYPREVLNTSTFIIEGYIEGEEYAIDCYFNDHGEAIILNILHHKFSSGTDISDRVYTTSKAIILKLKDDVELFLSSIGHKLGLKNFPLHAEIRIDKSGKICPIEINPLRFGGWCTTADLTWYAYGLNSYAYFIQNRKPDWDEILSQKNDQLYSIVVLNNNSGINAEEIAFFDYEMLKKDFQKVLITRKVDVKKYGIFGFIFTETNLNNEDELNDILVADLKKYIH